MKINTHKEEEKSYEITNIDRNGSLYGPPASEKPT